MDKLLYLIYLILSLFNAHIETKIEPMQPLESIEIQYNRESVTVEGETYTPVTAIVTAYAPYDNKSGICHDGTPDTTATGTKPRFGVLAADPKRIPYGTEIFIEGYGWGVVEDTGSALRNDKDNLRIDVFMDTYEEAMAWGKREMTILIKDKK